MTRFVLPLLVLSIFLSFFRLGSVTLFDVDEAVFAEATKEMVQSGNWITPTYNGENRYDKPILFYWLMAVSYKIFGISEFSARFPSALSAVLVALAVFLFVRRYSDETTAFYAAVPLVLSPYFLVYSHAAVTDMTLALFITLSLFCFYISETETGHEAIGTQPSKRNNAYGYGFYIFSALAFLTKGLIGIVFPFGIAAVFLVLRGGLAGIKRLFDLKGIVLFLLIAAPWYIIQYAINGQEFIEQFFLKHHFRRYLGVISGHRGPFYYYIPALIIGLMPWIFFLPGGIRQIFRRSDRASMTDFREANEGHLSSLSLFALVWCSVVLVFFSFSTTKLPNYILPAIPALTILISAGMAREDRWLGWENIAMAVVLVLAGTALFLSGSYLSKMGFPDVNWVLASALTLFAIACVGCFAALKKKTYYGALSTLMIVFLYLLSVKATPLASEYLQGTLYRYSLYAKERLGSDEKIITLGINNPSIVFYSDRKVVRTGTGSDLMPLLTQGKRLLIISKKKEIEMLKDLGFTLLESDGKYAILERQ